MNALQYKDGYLENKKKSCPSYHDLLYSYCNTLEMSNPCDTIPCRNGGSCIANLENWSYQCACSKYLSNDNCQDGMYCNLIQTFVVSIKKRNLASSKIHRSVCKCKETYN